MNYRKITQVLPALTAIFGLLLGAVALAAETPKTASLTEKGIRVKTEKDGTVSEIDVGPKVDMTLEDYQAIGTLQALKRVNISPKTLRLNDETAATLAHLDQVETFFANGAEMTDDGFKAFSGWKNLHQFGLDHWAWKNAPQGGFLGAGLANLASIPDLQSLRLGGCKIDNRATEAIAQIKSLQKIDLQHAFAITDEGIAVLKTLPKLQYVKLNPNFNPRLGDGAFAYLGDIKTLEEVEFNESILTYEKGLSHLKNLPLLKKIVLTHVVAIEDDIAKLKADHPNAEVTWTQPEQAQADKARAEYKRYWEKQGK